MNGGWVHIQGAAKWHYILGGADGGRSLCGRWLFLGPDSVLQDDNHGSPDNCKLCRVRRDQKFPKPRQEEA